jgi:quaternary ammonium compound-resistance protein SugE
MTEEGSVDPKTGQSYLVPAATTFPCSTGAVQDRDGPAAFARSLPVPWIVLVVAGLLEVVWATAMKQSHGFTRLWPSVVTIGAMAVGFGLLSFSMRSLPLGTAYMVWTGIGAVGAFVVGVAMLGEALTPARVLAALLIVGGLVLMKLSSPA